MSPGSEHEGVPPEASRPAPEAAPLVYPSAELFRGRKQIFIEHEQETYSLRITSKDKLLLTK
jgi:hemin uptake protein HemP